MNYPERLIRASNEASLRGEAQQILTQLHILWAIQEAKDKGFPRFAAALIELYRREFL